MKSKVIKMDIYQPFAHYREPKVIQDDYIPTLLLPPATTIAGFISYMTDRRARTKFKIGVIGTYKSKDIQFMRGEFGDFWSKYSKFIKGKKEALEQQGEYLSFFKDKRAGNRVMNFEVLNDVKLTIFIGIDDPNDYKLVKEVLKTPRKYLSLGRKEDFFVPVYKSHIVEEVEIESVDIKNKKNAIIENICLRNTYVPISLNSEDDEMKMKLNSGILYLLPKTCNFEEQKVNRRFEYGNYIYIDNNGYYPSSGKVQVYRRKDKVIAFQWLGGEDN